VLLKLAEGPASPRIVVGGASWRWQDLLFSHDRAAAAG